jgi:thioredoxin 1
MSKIVELTDESKFDEMIYTDGIVLVDFWAKWCNPCKVQKPILEAIINKIDNLTIIKVDVDRFKNIAARFKIMSIPSFILFKDGNYTKTILAFQTEENLIKHLTF